MENLSEDDKVKIFVSLIMSTDTNIKYFNNKLTIILDESGLEKIRTYTKNRSIENSLTFCLPL